MAEVVLNNEEEKELLDLMDSALNDFGKNKAIDDDLDDFMSDFDREATQKAANKFQEMLEKMSTDSQKKNDLPYLEKISDTDVDFVNALNKLIEDTKNVANASDENSLINALENMDDKNPLFEQFMESFFDTTMSKNIMYPAVQEMRKKFKTFFAEKKETIDEKTYAQYREQYRIITELEKLYECEKEYETFEKNSDNPKLTKITKLWIELRKHGLPPTEIADSMINAESLMDKSLQLTENPENCCLM